MFAGLRGNNFFEKNKKGSFKYHEVKMGASIRPLIISAQYNAELWSLSSEYALHNFRYRNAGPLNFNITGESYYLQGTYRLFKTLELLLRYNVRSKTKKIAKARPLLPVQGVPIIADLQKTRPLVYDGISQRYSCLASNITL